jgi:hypothetical protein
MWLFGSKRVGGPHSDDQESTEVTPERWQEAKKVLLPRRLPTRSNTPTRRTTMKLDRKEQSKWWGCGVVVFTMLTAFACNSGPAKNVGGETASAGSHIDVMCIGDRINNPPEPFHYSYKYSDASGSAEKEADITPQAMDITIKDNSGSHSYHGVHSDEASWNSAVLDLSGLNITAMAARLSSLNNTSSVTRQGSEPMNGYETSKYAIDTASANSSDKQTFETLFGKGSFEKGTVWVPADGCAVKLVLDEGIVQTNGSLNKLHYEIARVRK